MLSETPRRTKGKASRPNGPRTNYDKLIEPASVAWYGLVLDDDFTVRQDMLPVYFTQRVPNTSNLSTVVTVVTKIHCNLCHSTCITKDTIKIFQVSLRGLLIWTFPCRQRRSWIRSKSCHDQHNISFCQDTPCMRLKYRKALSESLACYGRIR